jgi:hypothetical protein
MNPLTQSKNTTICPLFIALSFACFALSPRAQAVNPPPDGGYPGHNTAEGDGALGSLTLSGKGQPAVVNNTALGFDALFNNTGGNYNTATGAGALFHNTTNGNTPMGIRRFLITRSAMTTRPLERTRSLITLAPHTAASGIRPLGLRESKSENILSETYRTGRGYPRKRLRCDSPAISTAFPDCRDDKARGNRIASARRAFETLTSEKLLRTHTLPMVAGLLFWQTTDLLHFWNYTRRFPGP